MAQEPLTFQGLLIILALQLYSETPHTIGLLWMNEKTGAIKFSWHHTTLRRDGYPYLLRDSNPQN